MSTYKRNAIYWYRFQWQGKLIRESTKQGNDKVARQMEAAHRTSLAKGEVGIREKRPSPTVREFLQRNFLPYIETRHAAKPGTLTVLPRWCEDAAQVGRERIPNR